MDILKSTLLVAVRELVAFRQGATRNLPMPQPLLSVPAECQ